MKFTFCVFVFSCFLNASGQIPIINIYNINDSRQTKIETVTNAEKVTGQPYFIDEWYKGNIILENGNTYKNYFIKYNTNNQTVLIQQGKELIEVEQKIKEFTLDIDVFKKVNFINVNVYNEKLKGYYEIVDDNKACRLLRFNKKIAESNSEKFTNITESKTFQNTIEYFIYNKALNKISSYKKADPTLKNLYELNLL